MYRFAFRYALLSTRLSQHAHVSVSFGFFVSLFLSFFIYLFVS